MLDLCWLSMEIEKNHQGVCNLILGKIRRKIVYYRGEIYQFLKTRFTI